MFNKRILLKAYCELNLGDDLFLKIILERYPLVQFYVIADPKRYVNYIKEYKNLVVIDSSLHTSILDRVFYRFNKYMPTYICDVYNQRFFKKVLREYINLFDGFVMIGGSMFIENIHRKWQANISYYKFINKTFVSKPTYFLGCNFGPFHNQLFLKNFKDIFENAEDVSFRDNYSFNLFQGLNIRCNPDIVFSMNTSAVKVKNKNLVGFVLIDPRFKMFKEFDYDKYLSLFSDLIVEYKNKGFDIRLFSFCGKEGDDLVIMDLLSRIKLRGDFEIDVVSYMGELRSFLESYQEAQKVYCGRFHSLILSMLYSQDVVPISYSKKMDNMLEDITFKGQILDLNFINNMNIEELIDNNNSYCINDVALLANNHFKKLDEFLK
ncbi:hypothetical protein HMPREF9711_00914 [Myroides odoratimimus CCUG 3837]|uniref:polysaccharide pyruvyl transferase family protein n=1 Tax=Myroides odoratimimus TaxID=76832 RepID=UPI000280A2E9|nr:polysaccharide pyruvyl transferase family protein [Myroides odoratimimus]EKB05945.1 hypothetical protein HMPREF9711_00914 [Myroides odoratimimus CCUG 3837]